MSSVSWLLAAVFAAAPVCAADAETAIFAGGCLWCLEQEFSGLPGVIDVTTGFAGGAGDNPTLPEVASGRTGHLLAVRIDYAPDRISYRGLLDFYWRRVDPTDAGGQFCERGAQNRAAIFPLDDGQAAAATASRTEVERELERPLAVEVRPRARFWPAEPGQQDFARRNPKRYDFYRRACRIDERLRGVWGQVPSPG